MAAEGQPEARHGAAGGTIYLDGIAKTTPAVSDTLVGFQHTIEARDQAIGANNYTFGSWSDGGARLHTITVPATDQSYTATLNQTTATAPPAFVQTQAAESNSGTATSVPFTNNNTAGNLIVAYVIWNNTGAVSLSDTRGNTYASAGARSSWGSSWSSQVFYAKNVAGGANTVNATFATALNGGWGVVYVHEYSGVDKTDPLDVADGRDRDQRSDEQRDRDHDARQRPVVQRRRVLVLGDRGRDGVHHAVDQLRQPHAGPHRRDRRRIQRDDEPEQQRLGVAPGRLQGRRRHPGRPAADRGGRGKSAVGAGAAPGELLERGLERSRGQGADLQLDVRRRADLDGGQSEPYVSAAGHVHGAAVGLRRDEHHVVDADHASASAVRRRRRS